MRSNWQVARLGDYCTKIGSGSTPRGGNNVYLESGPYAFIRSQHIYNDQFKKEGIVYINEESAEKLNCVAVEENDILLNITGDSVARVCLAPNELLPARVNQHVAIIRVNPDELDSRFVRYYLVTPFMQNHMMALASTGGTRKALTKAMIEAFDIPKPELKVQKKIADILSSFDKKISFNRKTNETLEQIAQAIFKSWFVDFDPVKARIAGSQPECMNEKIAELFPDSYENSALGPIPKGWKVNTMKDICELITKGTTPRLSETEEAEDIPCVPFIKVKDISDDGYVLRDSLELIPESVHKKQLKRSILKANDLLFSIAGTIGRVAVVDPDLNDSNANQAVAILRLKNKDKYLCLSLYNLKSLRVQKTIATQVVQGVQANASLKNMGDILIIEPTQEILNEWNNIIYPLFQKQCMLNSQIRMLSELRYTLIPKLISGEIAIVEGDEQEVF